MGTTTLTDDPIAIGYPWGISLPFPAGYLQTGETVRVDFRAQTLSDTAATATASRSGDTVAIDLSETATATLQPGTVIGDLVLVNGSEERSMNARLKVPVVQLTTRPE